MKKEYPEIRKGKGVRHLRIRENILDLLSDFGETTSETRGILEEENDIEVLKHYFQLAKKAVSLEDFNANIMQQ